MCGRFTLWNPGKNVHGFSPSYNISPGMLTPVFIKKCSIKIKLIKWGIGNTITNTRSEGIEEKCIFNNLIKEKRCLIMANGFYEWKRLKLENKEEKMCMVYWT